MTQNRAPPLKNPGCAPVSHVGFRLAYLHLTLTHSKGQIKVSHIRTVSISKMVTDLANITIDIKYEVESGVSISIFQFDLGLF